MSALRNYRRSLSDRRASISEIYQQDVKRVSENSVPSSSRAEVQRRYPSSDEDDDENDCHPIKEVKPKERQRRFSLEFIFRKNKTQQTESKKKKRSQSTITPPTEHGHGKQTGGTTCV